MKRKRGADNGKTVSSCMEITERNAHIEQEKGSSDNNDQFASSKDGKEVETAAKVEIITEENANTFQGNEFPCDNGQFVSGMNKNADNMVQVTGAEIVKQIMSHMEIMEENSPNKDRYEIACNKSQSVL